MVFHQLNVKFGTLSLNSTESKVKFDSDLVELVEPLDDAQARRSSEDAADGHHRVSRSFVEEFRKSGFRIRFLHLPLKENKDNFIKKNLLD